MFCLPVLSILCAWPGDVVVSCLLLSLQMTLLFIVCLWSTTTIRGGTLRPGISPTSSYPKPEDGNSRCRIFKIRTSTSTSTQGRNGKTRDRRNGACTQIILSWSLRYNQDLKRQCQRKISRPRTSTRGRNIKTRDRSNVTHHCLLELATSKLGNLKTVVVLPAPLLPSCDRDDLSPVMHRPFLLGLPLFVLCLSGCRNKTSHRGLV